MVTDDSHRRQVFGHEMIPSRNGRILGRISLVPGQRLANRISIDIDKISHGIATFGQLFRGLAGCWHYDAMQRGHPFIYDKSTTTKESVMCKLTVPKNSANKQSSRSVHSPFVHRCIKSPRFIINAPGTIGTEYHSVRLRF